VDETPTAAPPHRIGVMGGDGVGPELVTQALRVLRRVSDLYSVDYELTEYPHSADHYLDSGVLLEEDTIEEIGALDALLFGAAGDPRLPEGTMERGLLLRLASQLDLGIGVRPGRLYTAGLSPLKDMDAGDIDIVIVRDTTEDAFAVQAGSHRQGADDEVAIGLLIYTRSAVERVTRYAFQEARRRRGRISLVHQANAIRAHELLPRVAKDVAREFPDITLEELYPDAAAMLMVSDPRRLDVVLTTYWIGGILSDLLGAIVGGIGLIASARLNLDRPFGLFEPAHGSAPKYAGTDRVSPWPRTWPLR
jgi:3-isopropylmalate dehydrogenase